MQRFDFSKCPKKSLVKEGVVGYGIFKDKYKLRENELQAKWSLLRMPNL